MLEHLHFRKLGRWEQNELYYEMECHGTTLRATTYKDALRFYLKVNPKNLMFCIGFLEGILSTYDWTHEMLEKEKHVVMCEINEKDSYFNFRDKIDRLLWGKDPLSMPILGSEGNVQSFTLQQMLDFKRQIFCKENIAIVITGKASEIEILAINEKLCKYNLSEKKEICFSTNKLLGTRQLNIQIIKNSWNPIEIKLIFDVDPYKNSLKIAELLSLIIGGGTGSILACRIREELGYTYDISSNFDSYKDIAYIEIGFMTDPEYFYQCLEQIIDILNSAKKDINQRDMDINLPFFADNCEFWLNEPETLNRYISTKIFSELKSFSIEDIIKTDREINLTDLKTVASNIFVKNNCSIIIAGETNRISKRHISTMLDKL